MQADQPKPCSAGNRLVRDAVGHFRLERFLGARIITAGRFNQFADLMPLKAACEIHARSDVHRCFCLNRRFVLPVSHGPSVVPRERWVRRRSRHNPPMSALPGSARSGVARLRDLFETPLWSLMQHASVRILEHPQDRRAPTAARTTNGERRRSSSPETQGPGCYRHRPRPQHPSGTHRTRRRSSLANHHRADHLISHRRWTSRAMSKSPSANP